MLVEAVRLRVDCRVPEIASRGVSMLVEFLKCSKIHENAYKRRESDLEALRGFTETV